MLRQIFMSLVFHNMPAFVGILILIEKRARAGWQRRAVSPRLRRDCRRIFCYDQVFRSKKRRFAAAFHGDKIYAWA